MSKQGKWYESPWGLPLTRQPEKWAHLQRSRQRCGSCAGLGGCWCWSARRPERSGRCRSPPAGLSNTEGFFKSKTRVCAEWQSIGHTVALEHLCLHWRCRCRRLGRRGSCSASAWGCCPSWSTRQPWRCQRSHCPRWSPDLAGENNKKDNEEQILLLLLQFLLMQCRFWML